MEISFEIVDETNYRTLKEIHFETHDGFVYKDGTYRAIVRGKYAYAYIVKLNDEYVGQTVLRWSMELGVLYLYITSISVLPKFRRKGIGNQIIHRIIDDSNGCPIFLHVKTSNEPAIKLYIKNNFQILDTIEEFYVDSDALLMRRVCNEMKSLSHHQDEIMNFIATTPKNRMRINPRIAKEYVEDLVQQEE